MKVKHKRVVYAKWEDIFEGKYANPCYRCSNCKERALYKLKMTSLGNWENVQALTPFCPHCGAEMEGAINET